LTLSAIALADAFTGQYRDRRQFMEMLAGKLAVAARQAGWRGVKILDVSWCEPPADPAASGWKVNGPIAALTIGPGAHELTVDAVRAAFRDRIEAQKKQATQERLL
jgi:hypothetical protein